MQQIQDRQCLSVLYPFGDFHGHAYVDMTQRKEMQDGQAVYSHVHKQFLAPDHVVRQYVKV